MNSENKKWDLLSPQIHPSGQMFTRSHSTCKYLPAHQISTS